MPKQLIEVDVPEGFELDVDTIPDTPGGRRFNNEMTAMFVEVRLRRKLSYEPSPPRTSVCSNYAFGIDMAAEGTKDFTAYRSYEFTLDELRGVSVVPDPDYGRCGLDSMGWNRRMSFISTRVFDLSVDSPSGVSVHPSYVAIIPGDVFARSWYEELILLCVGISTSNCATHVLGCSAQQSPPEPVPIESDLSEQVTRLLRHLGIEQPPTSDEVEDMLSQTLRSIAPVKWADISKDLAKHAKQPDDWQWPEWLDKEWLFLTQRGVWMAGNDEPELRDVNGDWWIKAFSGTWEAMSPDFVPPPCTDWRQSKRRNPQWKD